MPSLKHQRSPGASTLYYVFHFLYIFCVIVPKLCALCSLLSLNQLVLALLPGRPIKARIDGVFLGAHIEQHRTPTKQPHIRIEHRIHALCAATMSLLLPRQVDEAPPQPHLRHDCPSKRRAGFVCDTLRAAASHRAVHCHTDALHLRLQTNGGNSDRADK